MVIKLIKSPESLYKFEEQKAKKENEAKFKLWFRLNYLYDLNVYVVMNVCMEKDLNRLEIVSVHKVKRKIQEKIENAGKD
jgi:hypothetical protein